MAEDIRIPELGESITDATIAKWLKQVGDTVAVDEDLVELESDKAALEMPSPVAGTLVEILAKEGETVEIGAVIARIGEADAAAAPAKPDAAAPAAASAPAPTADSGKDVEITVPEAGESVTEGEIGTWFKQEGDAVAQDEALVDIETDKAAAEVPSPVAGVLKKRLVAEGDTVQVGQVIAIVTEGATAAAATSAAAPAPAAKAETAAPAPAAPPASDDHSPAVRRLLSDYAIDPKSVSGTGKDGRLTKEDIIKAISDGTAKTTGAPASAPAATAAPAGDGAPSRVEERVPMTRMRKRIAERLKDAQNTAAMLTTFNDVDMTAVMGARKEYKDMFEKKHGIRLGFMSFFVKAACLALKEVPAVNARIDGEEIVYNNYVDVGVAVSTPAGLVVPIVRNAESLSFADTELTIADLGRRGRDGKLGLKELQGGTFTITNGGVFGSMLSTPILNPPQSAILGMHRIEQRPVAMGGQVVIRPMMYLALSYDHRIIDGREAVTALVRMKEAIEDPNRLLLDL